MTKRYDINQEIWGTLLREEWVEKYGHYCYDHMCFTRYGYGDGKLGRKTYCGICKADLGEDIRGGDLHWVIEVTTHLGSGNGHDCRDYQCHSIYAESGAFVDVYYCGICKEVSKNTIYPQREG